MPPQPIVARWRELNGSTEFEFFPRGVVVRVVQSLLGPEETRCRYRFQNVPQAQAPGRTQCPSGGRDRITSTGVFCRRPPEALDFAADKVYGYRAIIGG